MCLGGIAHNFWGLIGSVVAAVLPTTRDIFEPTVYLWGESGRNCQVRLGAPSSPGDSRSHASNADLVLPFNMLTKPRPAAECLNCWPAEPLAALRHHAGIMAQSWRTNVRRREFLLPRPGTSRVTSVHDHIGLLGCGGQNRFGDRF